MERVFFRPSNGEVGLTPSTRAIIEECRKKEERREVLDPYSLQAFGAEERLTDWRKNK